MKIQLFSLSGIWCNLQKFLWPFLIFLRSLMPKKFSGMQRSYFWTGFHHQTLTNQISNSESLCYSLPVKLSYCEKASNIWKKNVVLTLLNNVNISWEGDLAKILAFSQYLNFGTYCDKENRQTKHRCWQANFTHTSGYLWSLMWSALIISVINYGGIGCTVLCIRTVCNEEIWWKQGKTTD